MKAALFNTSGTERSFQFYTSVLSLTEIKYIENLPGALEDGFARIDEFWQTAPILLFEVNMVAAVQGRVRMRDRLRTHKQSDVPSVRKRATDLVHLSTPIWLNVDEFWTYDVVDFSKYPQQRVVVREPYGEQMLMPDVQF